MEKDLLVAGAGSSLGQKRMRADGDAKPISLELSLGAIYGGAAAASTPKVEAGDSCVAIAQALSMPHHSAAVAAALNLVAQAPGPAALLAAGAEIASSLLDGGDGAAATLLASLPLVTSSCIHAAPAAALNLVAHVPVPAAGAPFVVGTGTSPAPPPRASPAARSQRQIRRRIANASPPKSSTGDAPALPTNGAAPPIPIPPFPWATNRVAIHHPIDHLLALGITTVEGEEHCSHCDARKTVSYDIASKFQEVRDFVARNVHDMDDRAPDAWLDHNGLLRDCDACGQRRSVRPVIPPEKERINWVFLLLGQKLGLCTLDQIKFFCARTRQHRTGAKDRVLYLAYMELCNQLCPDSLFNLTAERQNRGRQYCH